jgi:hypothetical protein
MVVNLSIFDIFPPCPILKKFEAFVGEWTINGNVMVLGFEGKHENRF